VSGRDDGALWSGRFSVPPSPEAAALGRSTGFDLRLVAEDIRASVAHVAALEDAGLLTEHDARTLTRALEGIGTGVACA